MRKSEVFPSRFLKAADLKNGRLTVEISEVVKESIVDGEDDQPVVYFEGQPKGLVLNVTNWNMLEELSGSDESDDWVGLRIVLYVTKVDFQGRRVPAIRIEPAPSKSSAGNGGTGGARAQKPLPLADKADEPDCGENDPDTEPDAEGFPEKKKVAGGKS
jgi:hypothetical protein